MPKGECGDGAVITPRVRHGDRRAALTAGVPPPSTPEFISTLRKWWDMEAREQRCPFGVDHAVVLRNQAATKTAMGDG